MSTSNKGTIAHLQGNLTHSGVSQNIITSLAGSLQKSESGCEKIISIDCGKVRSADFNGLQLLYVWMQCAKFRGVATKLVNLPESLQMDMQRMGTLELFCQ
jgi:ABC-type transporter Mla MlaB component